jgi:hypothetical protein
MIIVIVKWWDDAHGGNRNVLYRGVCIFVHKNIPLKWEQLVAEQNTGKWYRNVYFCTAAQVLTGHVGIHDIGVHAFKQATAK